MALRRCGERGTAVSLELAWRDSLRSSAWRTSSSTSVRWSGPYADPRLADFFRILAVILSKRDWMASTVAGSHSGLPRSTTFSTSSIR
jgi:hypothetical protein